ncbi:MAG: hypothetical protein VX768_00555 [Planctomycetota bacterium]|nr:hypothetical protein [Planctomycetota bacterium]
MAGRPLTKLELTNLARCEKIRKIRFANHELTEGQLKYLRLQDQLFELDLEGASWRGHHLPIHSGVYPHLVKLNVSHSSLQCFQVPNIRNCTKLREVSLRGIHLNDREVRPLLLLEKLKVLDLCETSITYDGLKDLKMPGLETLKLSEGVLTKSQRETILHGNPKLHIIKLPKKKSGADLDGRSSENQSHHR